MKTNLAVMLVAAAALARPVLAQEISSSARSRAAAATTRALEIGLGVGYSQGVGDIGGNSPTLTDLSHGGGEVQLSVGYRLDPHWLIGVYGTGGKYTLGSLTPDGSDVWSATAGVQANYHLMPDEQWDPWIGLGTGWRGHWISRPGGTDSRHGLDLARLQVGVDYRVTPAFSLSPYVGASASMFLTQERVQDVTFTNVPNPNVNFFFVGGVMGRFDLLGTGERGLRLASN